MNIDADEFSSRSRLKALLHHFAEINDPREAWRVMYPLPEILLLAVCGTVCDCDGYEHIAAWGETHVDFLRRYLLYERGTPCGRWLTVFMNRINPGQWFAKVDNAHEFVLIDRKDGPGTTRRMVTDIDRVA